MGDKALDIKDQSKVRKILDVLCSGPKLEILRMLIDEGSLSASDIAKKLGIKLSTVLNHLSDLVDAGLVGVKSEGIRGVKKYFLISNLVKLELDIKRLVAGPESSIKIERTEDSEIESLALEYVRIKRSHRRGKLPLRPKVRDVMSTLGVDVDTAIRVVDYINTHHDKIADALINEVIDVVKGRGEINVRELAEKLKVHPYWAVMCIEKLVRKGVLKFKNGIIRHD